MDENFPYKKEADYAIDLYIKERIELGELGELGELVGNLGLHDYNFSLGISEGSNPIKAHRAADKIDKSLPQHWQVKEVPEGKSAFPIKSCRG